MARQADGPAARLLLDQARGVADAVLYEGYLLYPYRRSSGKNRVRWQFGVLAPRSWVEAAGPDDETVAGSTESWWQQTECLLEPAHGTRRATVTLRLRFLQLQARQAERDLGDGFRPVGEVEIAGQRYLSFEEAVPREVDLDLAVADLLDREQAFPVEIPGGTEVEPLPGRVPGVGTAARISRHRRPLSARLQVSVARCAAPFPLLRLRIRTENAVASFPPTATREQALRRSLISAHSVVIADGARFVSLLDPPAWAAEEARACRNVHTFPVLLGEPGTSGGILSSPIILYDHPRIAPESPGDLHDATEIDEILSLRTLTLTDEEKREVRGTDPRAAAILDRVDGMPPEVLERLHGAVRSLRPATVSEASEPSPAWWLPGGDDAVCLETDTVLVGGIRIGRGSRVRLRPRRRGGDAHDMFLEGRTARVEQVLLDVDGTRFLAVAVEDDPGADLHQWYGRLRHFRPEEVESVPDHQPHEEQPR